MLSGERHQSQHGEAAPTPDSSPQAGDHDGAEGLRRRARPRADSVGPTSRAALARSPDPEARAQQTEIAAVYGASDPPRKPALGDKVTTPSARLLAWGAIFVLVLCVCALLGDDAQVHCGGPASPENVQCQLDVEWAFAVGRFEPWAPQKYSAMLAISGVSHLEATQDDFQRLFFCESWPESRCGATPCTCSRPPCHTCGPEPVVAQGIKPMGAEGREQPSDATYAEVRLVKGIGYAPAPVKHQHQLPNDDFMCDAAGPMWASPGRGDLALIRKLGADTVRLYGSDPNQPHRAFLDEAHRLDLKIIAGTSDYPFLQMPGSCKETGFDCYEQLKTWHTAALRSGYADGRSYHPSLSTLIVINELDVKLDHDSINNPKAYTKAIISAIDGVVDAEREAGVTQNLPRLSATFSFGICATCSSFNSRPALGQMNELRAAMRDPSSYGYAPRNNLSQVYDKRVIHSFNTFNAAEELRTLFLDTYDAHFHGTPVFIGEFHPPGVNQAADLQYVQQLVHQESSMLAGVVFFEFQRRYDKGNGDGWGPEREHAFGMFELGSEAVATIDYFGLGPSVWCLVPSGTLQDAVAAAFEGSALSSNELCGPGRRTS